VRLSRGPKRRLPTLSKARSFRWQSAPEGSLSPDHRVRPRPATIPFLISRTPRSAPDFRQVRGLELRPPDLFRDFGVLWPSSKIPWSIADKARAMAAVAGSDNWNDQELNALEGGHTQTLPDR